MELLTFFSLLYMGVCGYRVVFKIRIFNWFHMLRRQQTDAFRHACSHRHTMTLSHPSIYTACSSQPSV